MQPDPSPVCVAAGHESGSLPLTNQESVSGPSARRFEPGPSALSSQRRDPGSSTLSSQRCDPGSSTISSQRCDSSPLLFSGHRCDSGPSALSHRRRDPGASPLSSQTCPFPPSNQRHDSGPSPLCASSKRYGHASSFLYAANQGGVDFQLLDVTPVCSGGALSSTFSCSTTESTCIPSQRCTESSIVSGGAYSSSLSPYFTSEPGPSPLCLANQRRIQSSLSEMWGRERLQTTGSDDNDSGSERMVPSPPQLEDMDIVVRELLRVVYVWEE